MKQFILSFCLLGLFSCQSKQKAIIVNTPVSEVSNFETNDSSYLKIKIEPLAYEISFLNKKYNLVNLLSLDSFLQKNKDFLNKDKVVVTNFDTTNKHTDFKEILIKNGISRFRVNRE